MRCPPQRRARGDAEHQSGHRHGVRRNPQPGERARHRFKERKLPRGDGPAVGGLMIWCTVAHAWPIAPADKDADSRATPMVNQTDGHARAASVRRLWLEATLWT